MSTATTPTTTAADVEDREVRLDGLAPELVELREITAKHRHYKRLRDKLEKDFKARLADGDVGTIDGVPVISYRETERVFVSVKDLEARYPEIAEACRDIAPVRTFLLLD